MSNKKSTRARILRSKIIYKGPVFGVQNPRQAAARELLEETGYRAKRYRVFLDIFPTPGFLEERMYILLAQGLTSGDARPEEDEKISSRVFSRSQLRQMIRRGKLRDAKTIAGLLYYFSFLASPSTSKSQRA